MPPLKLNWRLVFVHGLVYWLFPAALQLWAFIGYIDLLVMCFPPDPPQPIAFIQQTTPYVGMLLPLWLCIRLCRKRTWPIASTLLGFLLSTLFSYYGPGIALADFPLVDIESHYIPIKLSYILSGTLVLGIGLLLLYSRPVIAFIETGRISFRKKPTTGVSL